jgi:hypothetical protein
MRRGTHRVSRPYIRSVPICIDIVMRRCQQPRITGYRLNQKELEKVTLQPGVLISGLFSHENCSALLPLRPLHAIKCSKHR